MRRHALRTLLLMASASAALGLASCRDDQQPVGPQASLPVNEPLIYAPDAAQLPTAKPAPVAQRAAYDDAYGWADQAYGMDYAFNDAPPDYAFDYEGVRPWAWRSRDDYSMVYEPLATGGRYYYYQPGAERPFFVRDPDYGYAYDRDGRLAALYQPDGGRLPYDALTRYAALAGSYISRGERLHGVAERPPQRLAVSQTVWARRQAAVAQTQQAWIRAAESAPAWRDYRARKGDDDIKRFREERDRREVRIANVDRRDSAADAKAVAREADRLQQDVRQADKREERIAEENRKTAERDARRQAQQAKTEQPVKVEPQPPGQQKKAERKAERQSRLAERRAEAHPPKTPEPPKVSEPPKTAEAPKPAAQSDKAHPRADKAASHRTKKTDRKDHDRDRDNKG